MSVKSSMLGVFAQSYYDFSLYLPSVSPGNAESPTHSIDQPEDVQVSYAIQ